jgi:hypothetical protein
MAEYTRTPLSDVSEEIADYVDNSSKWQNEIRDLTRECANEKKDGIESYRRAAETIIDGVLKSFRLHGKIVDPFLLDDDERSFALKKIHIIESPTVKQKKKMVEGIAERSHSAVHRMFDTSFIK